MPVEILRCTDQLQPFFNELPMPRGLNGREERFENFSEVLFSTRLSIAMEVYRRMQDLHDTLNRGRFFLCISQLDSYTDFYKVPSPSWALNWTKSQFLLSSLNHYNAAFDFFLQVNWLCFELFKTANAILQDNKKCPETFNTRTLRNILKFCNVNLVLHEINKPIIGTAIHDAIDKFRKSTEFKEVHTLTNTIKHKQSITFPELSEGKHQFYINYDRYNSQDALVKRTIPELTTTLKEYHKEFSKLCDICVPLWHVNRKDEK